jgi:hypothetical protein
MDPLSYFTQWHCGKAKLYLSLLRMSNLTWVLNQHKTDKEETIVNMGISLGK